MASRRKTAQGLAQRARIVLLAAEGAENKDISLRVDAAPNTVGKWRRRFAEHRLDGLRREYHTRDQVNKTGRQWS
jgi:transposase-like protein